MTVLLSSIFVAQPNLALDLILRMLTELIYINLVDLVRFPRFSSFFSLFLFVKPAENQSAFLENGPGFLCFLLSRFFTLF